MWPQLSFDCTKQVKKVIQAIRNIKRSLKNNLDDRFKHPVEINERFVRRKVLEEDLGHFKSSTKAGTIVGNSLCFTRNTYPRQKAFKQES